MRFNSMEEWNRYLDSQFLDKEKDGASIETSPDGGRPTDDAPAPLPAATVKWSGASPAAPPADPATPEACADEPAPPATASDLRRPDAASRAIDDPLGVAIPVIERYMPWLSDTPSPPTADGAAGSAVSPPEPKTTAPAASSLDESRGDKPMQLVAHELEVAPVKPRPRSRAGAKSSSLSAPRPRWRTVQAEVAAAEGPAFMERLPDELLMRLPAHMKFLAAVSGYQSAVDKEGKRRRRKDESRGELIERLVDPVLTLDETAVLLGVCPTTIRRYTQKGWLNHHRTQGQQRRFRLSDVVAFLEQHGRTAD